MPKKLVFLRNKFIGYTSNFVDGDVLLDCKNYDYSEFLRLYNSFINKACLEISDQKIEIIDSSVTNIMFNNDEKKFTIVDPDLWICNTEKSILEIKSSNFKELSYSFENLLYLCYLEYSFIDENTDFIDFYETLRAKKEKKYSVKIKTIKDMISVGTQRR